MRLYAFYSNETGETADFCVIAETEEEARRLVADYIAAHFDPTRFEVAGWPRYYGVEVREAGQVASNWAID